MALARAPPPPSVTWDDAMARATDTDLANCRPYSIRDTYEDGDVVHHPVFDIGFVIELLPDNKVEVIFRDGGSRILVHNRGDLAARMPDISEIPIPREAKKKKRAKKPETPPRRCRRAARPRSRPRSCAPAPPRRRGWTRRSAVGRRAQQEAQGRGRRRLQGQGRARSRPRRPANGEAAGKRCEGRQGRQARQEAGQGRGKKPKPAKKPAVKKASPPRSRPPRSPPEEAGAKPAKKKKKSSSRSLLVRSAWPDLGLAGTASSTVNSVNTSGCESTVMRPPCSSIRPRAM